MPPNGPETTRGESTWRVIARELKAAPPQARRALVISALGLDVGVVITIYDLWRNGPPEEAARLIAPLTAIAGTAFLLVAQVLHQVSQGLECSPLTIPTVKQKRFHRSQLALPLLCSLAVVFLAMSVGVLIPIMPGSPLIVVMAVFIAAYLVYAIRMIQHTARFLYTHAADQADAAARARAEATEAQLTALRAQMNPHFLFNALNTVAALVRTNHRAAEATVEHLSEVLRRTLDRSQSNRGTVAEEIEYLHAYLAVEQERYGARLNVNWSVADDALSLDLPPLTLQPLVENALRHGIGSRLEGGSLDIDVARSNGHLTLAVADNGVGFPARYEEGTGLGNLRQRLLTLYGGQQSLQIESTPTGSRVSVNIPAVETECPCVS